MPPRLALSFALATPADAAAIAALRTEAAERLTSRYGHGHWSSAVSEKAVLGGMEKAKVIVARSKGVIVGVLKLSTRKPWAIDPAYFTPVEQPLYLTDIAVAPNMQGRGVGRRLLDEARRVARDWPADAIRLDAYDAAAGAGGFYAACGFEERARVTYRKTPLVYYQDVHLEAAT
jgi:ribosomal protein S18 acetylase RimI-like enzyme